METYKLFDGEYRFMRIIWDKGSLTSRELADEALKILGWKRTTAYTVLKKLVVRGYAKNEEGVVTPAISHDVVRQYECETILERSFDHSLLMFLGSALEGKKLTDAEYAALKNVLDSHR